MNYKKMLSLLLAASMAVSMPINVFAVQPVTETENQTEVEPYIADVTAPTLSKISLNATEVNAGETITVNVEGMDDISGIGGWDVTFESDSGEQLSSVTVLDGATGTETVEIEVSEYKSSGVYHLISASVWDKAGNSRNYSKNPIDGFSEALPHDLSITVINSAEKEDTTAPTLSRISLSAIEVNAGETITVNVEGTDDISGIDGWDVVFESDNGEYLSSVVVSDGMTENVIIEVSEYKPSGVYHLVNASVWDKAGNSKNYSNDPVDGYSEALPHSLSITVNNTEDKEDTQAPTVSKILLSDTEVNAGETITVNVEGTDDISGIDGWDVVFESDNGEYLSSVVVSDGMTENVIIEVSEYKPSGVYHLINASAWDKAGNSRNYSKDPIDGYSEALPHDLSITVINDDNIPTPTPDPTPSNPDKGTSSNSSSSSSSAVNYESEKPNPTDKKAVEAYNFWQNAKAKVRTTPDGKTMRLFVPKDITYMPASMMETLYREKITLIITHNGKKIVIPAGKAMPKQKLKVYWTFESLEKLYQA